MEFGDNTFYANILAPLTDWRVLIASASDLALATVETCCLFGAHACAMYGWD
jgi:hypothetical protein